MTENLREIPTSEAFISRLPFFFQIGEAVEEVLKQLTKLITAITRTR